MKIKILLLLAACHAGTFLKAQQVLEANLDELFGIANQNSQQIRVSMTGHEAAYESTKSAKSQRLPDIQLHLNGNYIGNASVLSRRFSRTGTTTVPYAIGAGQVENGSQPTPHWGNDFVAQVTQVIYAGGGIAASIKLADQGEKMALLDIEKNRQEVRFVLTGHYLELYKLHNQLKVVRKNIELAESLLQAMHARLDEGTALQNDITRYELQLQSLQLNETRLAGLVDIENHQLVTMLHLPADTEIHPIMELDLSENRQLDYWQSLALTDNLSLRQARLAADMRETEVKVARAARLPSIAAVAENRLTGPYVNDLIPIDANINAWFVGVGVRYDLGSLWRKNHDVKRARIQARQSHEQTALAVEHISDAVQADYVNLQTASVEVGTQKKQVELADKNYRVIRNRYDHGLALLTDMLDASHLKLSADIDLVNAQINLIYHYYKLKYITCTL